MEVLAVALAPLILAIYWLVLAYYVHTDFYVRQRKKTRPTKGFFGKVWWDLHYLLAFFKKRVRASVDKK